MRARRAATIHMPCGICRTWGRRHVSSSPPPFPHAHMHACSRACQVRTAHMAWHGGMRSTAHAADVVALRAHLAGLDRQQREARSSMCSV